MLANLTAIVQRGIIDNTRRDIISLQLWCLRDKDPLCLELPGNCLRDIAGCRVSFRRREPMPADVGYLRHLYKLTHVLRHLAKPVYGGDITFSRRAVSSARSNRLTNELSIEFFYGDTMEIRFLIEGDAFECTEITLPEWECSRAFENMQEMVNMNLLYEHVQTNVASFTGPSLSQLGSDMPVCKWDAVLNAAEAHMTIALSIRDKYDIHPRGRIAEAFVLGLTQYLQARAEEDEKGYDLDLTETSSSWEVTDFMEPQQAELVHEAMSHPLFEATMRVSSLVQKHIIAALPRYKDNSDVDTLLSQYAGIISHILATILLTLQSRVPVKLATERAKTIRSRVEKLKRYTTALPQKVRISLLQGMDALLSELQNFMFTLRK